MEIFGIEVSNKFDKVFEEAQKVYARRGIDIVFKRIKEHPNPMFHHFRGTMLLDEREPEKHRIYLNEELCGKELEIVAVHELCHIIANDKGFGYAHALSDRILESKLDIYEVIAITIGDSFTHLTVHKLTESYGYCINNFDFPILEKLRETLRKGIRFGTVDVAQNVAFHVSLVCLDKYSLRTLDLSELESIYEKIDNRILSISRSAQCAISNVDLLSVDGCYEATIALRDAIGFGINVELSSKIDYIPVMNFFQFL